MTFQWPNGNSAALSFTYDDGYPVGASVRRPTLKSMELRHVLSDVELHT